MNELVLRNRQRVRVVNTRLLRRVATKLLNDLCPAQNFAVGVHLLASKEMARLNEQYLGHAGSTDVITFDYRDGQRRDQPIHGEIFISIEDALVQAKQFRTQWQAELVRYLVHGWLHLNGFDDTTPRARRRMKQREDKLLSQLVELFPVRELECRNRRESPRFRNPA